MSFRPPASEYAPFYSNYIQKVPNGDFLIQLATTLVELSRLLEHIPEGKWDYRYEQGKWTIKELVLHIIDTERVMAFRALWIARNGQAPLPGFDQDNFVANANANRRTKASLIKELKSVRAATISLVADMEEDDLLKMGIASDNDISVRALVYIILGHQIHHAEVLKEKYLS